MSAKYKNITELATAFKAGELKGWVLSLDNDNTSLSWRGDWPSGVEPGSDEGADFEEKKYDEGHELYDGSDDTYILPEVLLLAGIPNEEV